ncbi:MAG: class I SAM-dependent methyltransferase [Desulfomonilaceae bacterium]
MEPESYKWNAQDYAKHSSGQFEWARELIAKLDLHGSESILDIGCADGKITYQLAEAARNGYVLGIDQSEEMIRMASELFPSAKHTNLSFLHMNAMDIRLSRKFDIVFSNATLHWVKDQVAVLRGVHKCLTPQRDLRFLAEVKKGSPPVPPTNKAERCGTQEARP